MTRRYLIIIFICLFLLKENSIAQTTKIDSLYKKLSVSTQDSVRARINFRIAYYFLYTDKTDSTYAHFMESFTIAQRCNSKLWVRQTGKELGFYFMENQNLDSSLYYFMRAAATVEKDDPNDYEIFSGIGTVYFFKGDYIKAYEYYLRFLKLAEMGNLPHLISRAYSSVGVTLKEQKKSNESLVFFKKALDIAEKHKLPYNAYVALVNIGNYYSEKYSKDKTKYNYQMTLDNYIKATDLIDSIPKNKIDASSVILLYGNIGNTYADAEEFDKALAEYDKALKLLEEIESFETISLFYNNLASIYIDMQDKKLAKKYLGLAYDAALKITGSANELMENYGTASRYYALTDDYKKAYLYQLRFKSLSDSLFSTENAEKRKEIELNAQYEKKELAGRIEQEKKDLLESEERKKQLILRNALITGFVLMLAVAFLILRGYRQKQKSNEIIIQQKLEVEKQKELVEEKQKEIVDSIHYAKRIQQSLMPTEKYIERNLKK